MITRPVRIAVLLAGSLLASLAVPASSQEGVNRADGSAKKDGEAIAKYLQMSRELVDFGRANRSPAALVVAAQLRAQAPLHPIERQPKTEGGATGATDDSAILTVASILAEAKAMSRNDPTIAALADDVVATQPKGRLAGPGYNVNVVPARGTDTYSNVGFAGGRYAEVYAEGSGRTDLDLFVYDQNGNLICSDTDASDVVYCGWTPRWNGSFTVKVINRGQHANKYALITN
ncbi:hypothetical protein [Prosthecomicrobium hirschii]|uniref:hypothetical protein n=1 Tax=Prosthecodimorpha hirschii TaxID=665126 RepID=UPI00221FDC44|nr:hypothetical protein [Prosthecomicrobium hirschii]MCW1839239.1 hypothetical protein [Prosthecomicrobium hirschii]